MKKYRFFYHYYRAYNEMSVHFKGQCMRAKDIDCRVPCETKWKPNQQPHLVMQGWANNVEIINNKAIIS